MSMVSAILSIWMVVGSFVAQFTQLKQSPMFDTPQKSRGVLTYREPDYLRWEYVEPQPLVWELEGNKGNMSRQIKSMVMLIRESIKGDLEKAQNVFDLTVQDNVIVMVPKKKELKTVFESVRVTLKPATQIAECVEMIETGGDKTIIYFTDIQYLEP